MDKIWKNEFDLYKDIQMRTGGEIYIGVIGPVRTGKSTLIKRMMDLLVLPNLEDGPEKLRIMDELPQSGSGRTITTTEPKFLPKEAFHLSLSSDVNLKVRLIDCVGYIAEGAVGHMEDESPRMVKTPWADERIPFAKAAEIGTRKVMQDHSTIGIVVTCDGSFSEMTRECYIEAENRTIAEMKKLGKPFIVVLNSSRPYAESVLQMAAEMETRYGVAVLPLNCEQLNRENIEKIFEYILKEFPITDVEFYLPKWVEMLSENSDIKKDLICKIKEIMNRIFRIQDIVPDNFLIDSEYVRGIKIENINLANGKVVLAVDIDEKYYYRMLSDITGENVSGEHELLMIIKNLAEMKREYMKVEHAIHAVKQNGYGVVMPVKEEIVLEEPAILKQGNRYGVKIRASAPSIHLIRANIETEISPLVGSENQAADLIKYIADCSKEKESIWETNIFGKSIEELVEEGIQSKISQIGEESQSKLQDTMQKIVNDSTGGMVCIII